MRFPWSKRKKEPVRDTLPKRHPSHPFIQTTSYSIPCWDLKKDTKRQYREATIRALQARYSVKSSTTNTSVRQLLSKDLGLRSWRTPPQVVEESAVWINQTVRRQQAIAITGIIQLDKNPKVSTVKIRMGFSGVTTLGIHDIDELYSLLPIIKRLDSFREEDELYERFGSLADIRMAAYFSEPYVFDPEGIIHITVESPEGNKTGDRLMLSGFVIEPAGMTIM